MLQRIGSSRPGHQGVSAVADIRCISMEQEAIVDGGGGKVYCKNCSKITSFAAYSLLQFHWLRTEPATSKLSILYIVYSDCKYSVVYIWHLSMSTCPQGWICKMSALCNTLHCCFAHGKQKGTLIANFILLDPINLEQIPYACNYHKTINTLL